MSKQKEIKRLIRLLQEFSLRELKALKRQLLARRPKKIRVSKAELRKFVKQNRSTKAIARYYKVSPRTITRRIKAYGLKGIRPKGRKRAVKRPRAPKPREEWITTKEYFDRLNSVYHFINIRYPAVRYINPKTLVCSNTKSNPKGKFTTVGIYYVVEESNVYFLYQTSARALANLLLKPHGSLGWYVLEEGIAEIGYRPELRYNVPYEYFRVPYGWLWRPDMQDRVEQLATGGPNDNYFFYTPKDLEK